MRRRRVVTLAAFGWLGSVAVVGCNALLGIEGAETAVPGEDASTVDGSVAPDGAPLPPDGAVLADADPGPCVDVASNPRHCGACGRDCLGGVCVSGQCQLVVVSNEEGRPTAIASDGEHVYWTNPALGDVRRANVAGGPVEIVFDGPPGTRFGERLVRHGEDVFFSVQDATDGGVFRCPRGGCAPSPVTVVDGLAEPTFFDVVGGDLVVGENVFSGRIGRCTLPCGGGLASVSIDERFPTYVTASGDAVLWDTLIPVQGNIRVARGGGVASIVTDSPVRELRVEGENVFHAVRGSGVFVATLDGGSRRKVTSGSTQTDDFALDGTDVYYADTLESGRIFRCPRAGCGDAGVLLARDQPYPHDISASGDQVFWTNLGAGGDAGGSVVRLRK